MGGRWRYKRIVSLKFTKITIQRYTFFLRRWTLAIETYSVLKVYRVYNTKTHKSMGGRWRYVRIVSLKLKKIKIQRQVN